MSGPRLGGYPPVRMPNVRSTSGRFAARPDRESGSAETVGSALGVQVLARGGRRAAGAVPLLAREHLVEPYGAGLEGHGRARQIQKPRAVGALADDGARLVGAGAQTLQPVAAGPRVVQPEVLDVQDLPARALHLGHGLGEGGEVPVREDVVEEEVRLAGPLPVELVVDAVVEIEPAVVEQATDAAEEGGIVRDPHMLDDPDGRDLVVTRVGRDVAPVTVFHETAAREPFSSDALSRPLGLGPRERDAVGAHAVVLGGPHREAPPPAPDVEQALAGLEPELAADQIELVLLGLLELAVGVTVVRAGVHHERIEKERVELVGDVVVMGDRARIVLLASSAHDTTSLMPKMESKTTRRRATLDPRTSLTASRPTASGSLATWRASQLGSPEP